MNFSRLVSDSSYSGPSTIACTAAKFANMLSWNSITSATPAPAEASSTRSLPGDFVLALSATGDVVANHGGTVEYGESMPSVQVYENVVPVLSLKGGSPFVKAGLRQSEIVVGMGCLLAAASALAQEAKSTEVVVAPLELKWGPAPPVFEKGASMAVVAGGASANWR